ncbi:MAG: helix-turn-helix domain-containing protein [Candidatus Omnitrophica bacterium]|nr:helix-turn-helix domain-containing protein [Candidatus Omnitrophota bacterium]
MKNIKELREIMTVKQLADYLQINELTIYKKVRIGEIPSIKMGRILRFKKEIIDKWLEIESGWDQEYEILLKKTQIFGEQAGITEGKIGKAIREVRDKEK